MVSDHSATLVVGSGSIPSNRGRMRKRGKLQQVPDRVGSNSGRIGSERFSLVKLVVNGTWVLQSCVLVVCKLVIQSREDVELLRVCVECVMLRLGTKVVDEGTWFSKKRLEKVVFTTVIAKSRRSVILQGIVPFGRCKRPKAKGGQ